MLCLEGDRHPLTHLSMSLPAVATLNISSILAPKELGKLGTQEKCCTWLCGVTKTVR
ncbi:MAG: hypothetical protein HC879_13680 [Leptolyngbyaceae cyanobacterium SL_5_9]|nr:hypothetical protein [Leptolyngbyaceae cyanobacterium SL_5_9]NJO74726.1 hypothetical protein [Leptolyngbyaceae cyanobacterium RM1_406_9]